MIQVGHDTDVTKWRTVWIITIAILCAEVGSKDKYMPCPVSQVVSFLILAKGEPQKWNAPDESKGENGKKDWFLVSFLIC